MSTTMRETVSLSLRTIFSSSPSPILPLSPSSLLRHIIARPSSSSTSTSLRLTDLRPFEALLEEFTKSWEFGVVNTVRDDSGELCVIAVRVTKEGGKKRKFSDDHDVGDVQPTTPPTDKVPLIPNRQLSAELQQVYALLQRGTAKGKLLAERFRSEKDRFDPMCEWVTKEECSKRFIAHDDPNSSFPSSSSKHHRHCSKVHFRPLLRPHTDPSLGHCSYLNTCYSEPTYALSPFIPHVPRPPGSVALPSGLGAGGRGKEKAPCRYLHFEVDFDGEDDGWERERDKEEVKPKGKPALPIGCGPEGKAARGLRPPQWINCDVRRFDYSVLGKFHVIMADPPWDIHMNLPYGTMTDDEMRSMPIPALQDEGLLFLWVTGRAMEVGRECLRHWGYVRVDEVVWLKTNQLQRVIRTGRTGHWLNHTKEHMLVGLKAPPDANGNQVVKWPKWVNRGVDVDVIVSEVRETSRKPEEVYGMIERMCPGGRKIEIFGRKHNARPGWLTLGNQLGPDQIHEPDLVDRIKSRYGAVSKGSLDWGDEKVDVFALASN